MYNPFRVRFSCKFETEVYRNQISNINKAWIGFHFCFSSFSEMKFDEILCRDRLLKIKGLIETIDLLVCTLSCSVILHVKISIAIVKNVSILIGYN